VRGEKLEGNRTFEFDILGFVNNSHFAFDKFLEDHFYKPIFFNGLPLILLKEFQIHITALGYQCSA